MIEEALARRVPRVDRMVAREIGTRASQIMKYPNELQWLAGFMIEHGVTSYLEVGVHHGALLVFLRDACALSLAAGVSLEEKPALASRRAENPDLKLFIGNSHEAGYKAWRAALGHVDLVLLDGDRSERGIRADYEFERTQSQRFIAIHDIETRSQRVGQFWRHLPDAAKVDMFVNVDPNVHMLCNIRDRNDAAFHAAFQRKNGIGAGIGILEGNKA